MLNYITKEMLHELHSPEECERFYQWITGQTCPIVENRIAFYMSDYQRWIEQGQDTKQNKNDWD